MAEIVATVVDVTVTVVNKFTNTYTASFEAAPAVFQIHFADESGKLVPLYQGAIPYEPRTYTELLDDDKMYTARLLLST